MSSIVYTGPLDGVVTPDGTVFPKGVPVPVPDGLAAALLLQTFAEASPTPTIPATSAPAASFTAAPADEPAAKAAPAPVSEVTA